MSADLPFARYRIITDTGCTFLFGPRDACAEIVATLPPEDVTQDEGCATMGDAWWESQAAANELQTSCEESAVRQMTPEVWWLVEKLGNMATVH